MQSRKFPVYKVFTAKHWLHTRARSDAYYPTDCICQGFNLIENLSFTSPYIWLYVRGTVNSKSVWHKYCGAYQVFLFAVKTEIDFDSLNR